MILENYKDTKTNKIIVYLFDLIDSKKIKANELMPSEFFIANKFKVSRNIVVAAYSKLEAIGAVYVIEKKGHFVSKNFNNLIKPISYSLGCDKDITTKIQLAKPDWFDEYLTEKNFDFNSYKKEYFKKDQLIMKSNYWISSKINLPEEFDEFSIIHHLTYQNFILDKVNYVLKYQKMDIFGCKQLVVVYMIGYHKNEVCIFAEYIIHPEFFVFKHDEYNLF